MSNKTERLPLDDLKAQFAPMPTTTRGSASIVSFHPTHANELIYCSGKCVIVRNVDGPVSKKEPSSPLSGNPSSPVLVYKGHNATTTVARFSPNGYWVASGDSTGKVRVWSYDNPEHTLKLEIPVFAGEVKDLAWGPDSKKNCRCR